MRPGEHGCVGRRGVEEEGSVKMMEVSERKEENLEGPVS